MVNLTTYLSDIKKLSDSIIFKFEDVGLQINRFIEEDTAKKVGSRSTWKYYLNLSGQYHENDEPMYVYNKYTDNDDYLSLELLDTYPLLKDELLKQDELYNNVVSKYPTQVRLIQCIINPIDMTTAINAKQGDILSYNKTLVQDNEYSLLRNLETFIKNHLARWYLREYSITDNLYLATVIAQLYVGIYNKLINIRLDKALTYEAHEFHMDAFFQSHREINKYTDILSLDSKIWLYKNIRYLKRHTGKENTFQIVIDKIFTENGIGIGEIKLVNEDTEIYQGNDYTKPLFNNDVSSFYSKELNNSYIINKGRLLSSDTILKREIDSEDITINAFDDPYTHYENTLDSLLTENTHHLLDTKILDIDNIEYVKLRTMPDIMMIIDNWFTLAFDGKLDYSLEFTDPITNNNYTLTPYQGMLVFFKLTSLLYEVDNPTLDVIKTNTTIDHNYDILDMVENTLDSTSVFDISEIILNRLPASNDNLTTLDEFKEYILDINKVDNLFWQVISNINNGAISSGLKKVQDELRHNRILDMSVDGESKTIDELLVLNDITLEITEEYDAVTTIDALIRKFTGIDLNSKESIKDLINNYIGLLKTLTSYSLQVLSNTEDNNTINSASSSIETISSDIPIFKITQLEFNPLENFIGSIKTLSDDSRDEVDVRTYIDLNIVIEKCLKKPLIVSKAGVLDLNGMVVSNLLNMNHEVYNRCYRPAGAIIDDAFTVYDEEMATTDNKITNLSIKPKVNHLQTSILDSTKPTETSISIKGISLKASIDNTNVFLEEDNIITE